MPLSAKQAEYLRCATHRWNFKVGAARAGKTYCDYFLIPMRIRACPKEGAVVLMGHTVGTLCRNLLDPMRKLWGESLVGATSGKSSSVTLFGRRCYLLGADKVSCAEKLRGSSIVYCYGDEVTTWNEEVFSMLKSRMDMPQARFDGTCNPASPSHWLKKFLDSGADLYVQHYVMDDNPHLSTEFLRNIKEEYAGTVWYDRLILGKWVAAEGVIYRSFANDPKQWRIRPEERKAKKILRVEVGVDFGGTKSGTSFVAVGFTPQFREAIVLRSVRYFGEVDAAALSGQFLDFLAQVRAVSDAQITVRCDNAEPILIRTLKNSVAEAGLGVIVRNARKSAVKDRIRLTLSLMSARRILLTEDCKTLEKALCEAVWDSRGTLDQRLDDGSTDIDSLDALEYALEPFAGRLTARQALCTGGAGTSLGFDEDFD
jgi:PBSX family phage terminase large subunit